MKTFLLVLYIICNNDRYVLFITDNLKLILQDCSNILTDCMDEEQMHSYKDEQYKNALENIEANIESWDSSKCPAVQ